MATDRDELLEEELLAYETASLLDRLAEHDVPANDVRNVEQIFSNPQVPARGMRKSASHPTAGEVEMPGSPMHFSRTPTEMWGHPPRLGEHTDEVLTEVGYEETRIGDLYAAGVLGDRRSFEWVTGDDASETREFPIPYHR